MPGVGGEDEDAEGAAELPEATAPEDPLQPQEPRNPQQVGPTLGPANQAVSRAGPGPGTATLTGGRESHGLCPQGPSRHTRAVAAPPASPSQSLSPVSRLVPRGQLVAEVPKGRPVLQPGAKQLTVKKQTCGSSLAA